MTLLVLRLLCSAALAVAVIHLLLSPGSCLTSFNRRHRPYNPRGFLFEEKTRLGSTPPSCHNKCNDCHPCMAVQVPTLPSHARVQTVLPTSQAVAAANRYSNYKPLGWKCRCGNHLFNP